MLAGITDLLGSQLAPLVAYIGPGADLALISSAIGLLFTMGASLTFLVLWPFRWLWRQFCALSRGVKDDPAASS
ncbi:MAG TPA: hypothetical protein VMP01_07660 [Pirellulaceae bacterium]|nr:hypothetical protein [Pirellulaceae bacterium]